MHSQSNSNLRFIGCGGAAVLSVAIHIGLMQIRLPVPPQPTDPQVKTPPLTIPQQAVQVRPQLPEQSDNTTLSKPPKQTAPPTQPPTPAPAQSPPSVQALSPPTKKTVAVEPVERSQEETSLPSQSNDVEENSDPDTPPEGSSEQESSNDLIPDQLLAKQWGGLMSQIQAEEANFGQGHSLQDIFIFYGRDNQFDLFFDASEQPKVKILNYQLFTAVTPKQAWEEKVLPMLQQQESIEILEEAMFAEGKVYRISQGEFVRYLNVLPLHEPRLALLLEMEEAPHLSKEN